MDKDLQQLLVDHASLLNRYGTDSPEAEAFVTDHRQNLEFVELATLARKLKKAMEHRSA